jgi:hypothetical protein
MSNLKNFIIGINNYDKQFVNSKLEQIIINTIELYIPKLNDEDKHILNTLTIYLVDIISYKYNFKKSIQYYYQWEQNNCRNIKSVILLLLPFVDDKEHEFGYIFNEIQDLNQLLYFPLNKKISPDILLLSREVALNKFFKYGNMAIGLLDDNTGSLDLVSENNKLIYEIMYHKFLSLLYTLEIINGKYFINCYCSYCIYSKNKYLNIYDECFCCKKRLYLKNNYVTDQKDDYIHCFDCNSTLCNNCFIQGRYENSKELYCFECRKFSIHKNQYFYVGIYIDPIDDWENASWYY